MSTQGSVDAGQDMELYHSLMDELSCDQIQQMMDRLMGERSFGFADTVQGLIQNGKADTLAGLKSSFRELLFSSFSQDRKMFVSILAVALAGAVFSNFSRILQGKEVAKTAFYIVYMLFFSILAASFLQVAELAAQTLENLLAFIKVMIPAFFISLSFTQGGVAAGAYYEFALAMIMVVNWLMVGLALPAIHLYFFLEMVNQLSGEDMFSKMAELIRDGVRFGVKTIFGLMMGMNVIQGLIIPVSAEVKNMSIVRMGGAIPGVGNSVSSVLQTVLCAGKLVKNAVGVAGVIAVFFLCAVPLLRMVVSRILLQVAAAVLQPVSDPRLIRGLSGAVKAVDLYIYTVGVGALLFISSIAVISAFTT